MKNKNNIFLWIISSIKHFFLNIHLKRKERKMQKCINTFIKWGNWWTSDMDGLTYFIKMAYIKRYELYYKTHGTIDIINTVDTIDIDSPIPIDEQQLYIDNELMLTHIYNFWKFRYPKYIMWFERLEIKDYPDNKFENIWGINCHCHSSKVITKLFNFEENIRQLSIKYIKLSGEHWDGLID